MATMKKITKIDAQVCTDLRPQILAALNMLKGLGLEFSLGGIKYGTKDLKVTLTATLEGIDLDRECYEKNCTSYGLKIEGLGQSFTDRGETYTIVGLSSSRRRYPVVLRKAGGKLSSGTIEWVVKQMGWKEEVDPELAAQVRQSLGR